MWVKANGYFIRGISHCAVTRIEMGTVDGDQEQFIETLTPPRLVAELAFLNERGQRYEHGFAGVLRRDAQKN